MISKLSLNSPKIYILSYLLTLKLFQSCMTFIFWRMFQFLTKKFQLHGKWNCLATNNPQYMLEQTDDQSKSIWQLWPIIQTLWHLKEWIRSFSHTHTQTQSKKSHLVISCSLTARAKKIIESRQERPGESLSSPWPEKRKQSKGFGAATDHAITDTYV